MQLQVAQVCRPDERGKIIYEAIFDFAWFVVTGHAECFDEGGTWLRALFFVKEWSVNPIRVALQCQRTAMQMRK
jgi:hypothetical protein